MLTVYIAKQAITYNIIDTNSFILFSSFAIHSPIYKMSPQQTINTIKF